MWSYALSKIPTIAVPGHVSDVMSVLFFTQQPYLSCLPKLFALRLKKPMLELHSLLVGLFWTFKSYKLNVIALKTPFQWETWSPPSKLNLWQWTFSSYSPELLLARILSNTDFAKLSYPGLWLLDDMPGVLYSNLNIVMLSIKTSGVDFTKGFKTWHKFSTEIRFMLIPIIVLFIAHEFITVNFWHKR